MEKTIKMYRLTENGAEVIKEVPKNLYSQYKLIGYKDYVEKPVKEIKEETKIQPKVNNKKGSKFKVEF